jgi:NAD(P)-dependent dehydrogenase (short-subunit alcohol dehydrogenase family)
MALSFSLASHGLHHHATSARRSVLVTGAAGNIGAYFAEHASARYDLTLMVRSEEERHRMHYYGKTVVQELADLEGLTRSCAGIDTVLHLAGAASPSSTWEEILHSNIIGTYHLMVAAKAAGCRRVIYASSIHAVSGYPKDVQVKTTDPVNPGDLYGVSKCFGEALSRFMAEQEGLSVIALRIGGFQPAHEATKEAGLSMLDAFITRRDLQQLLEKCIDDTSLKFGLFNALSGNRFLRLDLSDARELLGYAPADDTTALHPATRDLHLDQKVVAHNQSDPASNYQPGIREELSRANAAAENLDSPAPATSPATHSPPAHRKGVPHALETSDHQARSRTKAPAESQRQANPRQP